MGLMTRIADKTGALGSVVSAMGCAACFPALASFGAAIGLGFLSQYEGLFISRLLPLFAALAFLANALGWFSHRQWLRSLLGMIGPAIVFAATVWLLGNWWTANLSFLTGLSQPGDRRVARMVVLGSDAECASNHRRPARDREYLAGPTFQPHS
ncbi:organomercurial transporter MerC [Salmonella enterica subsp. enterica serovar Enteritidis]|nr:organomercurial transporter MerC [Salmonella enterica subsp. enterica serovar Enteritidis]EFA7717362.1 organomercurial transporter MerC [Escherichia coli]ECL9996808.1 organomercurial transporter MerC [Salmonella enterica subsp. enterica serovar Enteritidis]ECM0062547.1 organomercurial transporter MerC [Salmonella enterica subsp. enterica serovar Enteritidis]ECM0063221.1 organomercurial transporter MerC [Salmonella enterica subsp. enterica serovar Enteritidis]